MKMCMQVGNIHDHKSEVYDISSRKLSQASVELLLLKKSDADNEENRI